MIEPEFASLQLDAAILSPFATEFRYPTDNEENLDRGIVVNAIDRAQNILTFVEKKIK